MNRNAFKRVCSVMLATALVFGNMSSITARAETGEPCDISLINEDFSQDIWGSDAGWTVTVDDWSATGAEVSSFVYSSDSWMNKPSDESDNGGFIQATAG